MLAVADPALNFHVLQFLFRIVLPALLYVLFTIFLPRNAGAEDDVFAHAGGVEGGARGMVLLEAEFGPRPALGHAGVDCLFDDGGTNPAGRFHAFTVVVEAVGYHCFGAVFVGGDLLRGKDVLVLGSFFEIFGPVGAAVDVMSVDL